MNIGAIKSALPFLLVVAVVLALFFMLFRQLGLDSTSITFIDHVTGQTRTVSLVTVLPRDGISSINDPRFVGPLASNMQPGELVIGLDLGGQARAYPINLLSRHEIVNDVVGGVPVAVTW